MKSCYVYILASKRNGTLYTGFTSALLNRVGQHKSGEIGGFTKQYNVHVLVWFEEFNEVKDALAREKQLKNWKRAWKLELIEKMNPEWRDLSID
jgi:putative endonuclease